MFFSIATRPTQAAIGRGRSRKSLGLGLNISVSTPRRQTARFSNPRFARSSLSVRVDTMQRVPAAWNLRSAQYDASIGMGKRARRYCGNWV
jgi:hypothetical protein